MTHPARDVALAWALHNDGLNPSQIAKATGLSRSSVRDWIRNGRRPDDAPDGHDRVACALIDSVSQPDYAYLLGLYLGDGCLTACPRGVYKLRITCCDAYPHLIDLCQEAMERVIPNRVGRVPQVGCTEVHSHSKHWICLFPQHAPGQKHLRRIVLEDWQEAVAITECPREFLRGLIHSDGCRSLNTVKRGSRSYGYWRYQFTNVSDDIRDLFCQTCDRLGIEWRRMNARNISIAKRSSVEFMDTFIGPKT